MWQKRMTLKKTQPTHVITQRFKYKFFLDKYLNSTCIRIRLLQLPNIRKKFTNIFPGVLFQIIWKFGYDIIQPFPRVNFLCFTGS